MATSFDGGLIKKWNVGAVTCAIAEGSRTRLAKDGGRTDETFDGGFVA